MLKRSSLLAILFLFAAVTASAQWSYEGTTGIYVLDKNVGIGAAPGTIPVFVRKNGGASTLPTLSVTAVFTAGATWDGIWLGYEAGGKGALGSTGGPLSLWTYNGGTHHERMRILSTGQVGIGSTAPRSMLDVAGASLAGDYTTLLRLEATGTAWGNSGGALELAAPNNDGTTRPVAVLAAALTDGGGASHSGDLRFLTSHVHALGERMRITAPGNIGIGTTTPARRMEITAAAVNGQYTPLLRLSTNAGALAGSGGAIELAAMNNGDSTTRPVAVLAASLTDGGHNSHAGDLRILISNANAVQERMRITNQGFVGINTPAPTVALDVVGDARFTGTVVGGNIRAHYQDVAEWVPASEDLAPGTVVVVDPRRTNGVMPSGRAYDTAVAGVVSEMPGLLLGEEGPSKEQIATTGRVRVRVDATRRPVRIGDLLVTSDVAGTAMVSEPIDLQGRRFHQPGTIIGKALESLDSGTGEVLVLLSLQ